jgi:hypothetical protein
MGTTKRLGRAASAGAALLGVLGLLCGGGRAPGRTVTSTAGTGDPQFPREILLIRHAEKPKKPGDAHLSAQGKQRAELLIGLFTASPKRRDPFPKPDFIFATHDTDNSSRPRETVAPLAAKLGLPLNTDFRHKEGKTGIQGLSDRLLTRKKYAGKTVLVCWHHGQMRDLALALLARAPNAKAVLKAVPKKFPDDRFDLVWQITFDKGGNATFTVRPQRLLPGDRRARAGERRGDRPEPGLVGGAPWLYRVPPGTDRRAAAREGLEAKCRCA